MDKDIVGKYFFDSDWEVVFEHITSFKAADLVSGDGLSLGDAGKKALAEHGGGIYRHQYEAIAEYLNGENLAVTTPTASGKTLIFNVCAIEELARNPNARIAAIYPLKALASEQEGRWKKLLSKSGLPVRVGRIDGGVNMRERARILKDSRVIILTPDVIHAWLFSSINTLNVLDFLRSLSLVIVDEAHTYSGVFGSNAAYLFRRLLHATRKLGGEFKFIAASATMEDAKTHLFRLTGEDFVEISKERDTSPRSSVRTLLVNPPKARDILSVVSELISFIASKTHHQSITFVDSRKQTEYLATIVARRFAEDADSGEDIDYQHFKELQIYPYRSGYEEEDRQQIQSHLAAGVLKGVISTSALEMGVDLPYLTLCILMGIPRSATSFYQRIGRVGRKQSGVVIIVNNGSILSERIFRDPQRLRELPLATSALYLHNSHIQYIHAMCLARQGGEDEAVCLHAGSNSEPFFSPQELPADFVQLCEAERLGEVSTDLQPMKSQAGDDPHHVFPLRDLDVQFKVQCRQGPEVHSLGSLSHSQVLREAYPGAVYYYQTKAYRVVRVRKQQHLVEVRQEKRYFTSPIFLPTLILPNLTGNNLYQASKYGELLVIECAMQIAEAVVGFKERRGNNEFNVSYPLSAAHGLYQEAPRFVRYVFTSGVMLTHPALMKEQVKCACIAEIIGEAFLMSLPFERQDVSAGNDRHRASREGIEVDDRFICVYDQTYGSLRLTSHLMNTEVLREVFLRACDIAKNDPNYGLTGESLQALLDMGDCVSLNAEVVMVGGSNFVSDSRYVEVIMPGSIGLDMHKDNEEFEVNHVFFSPLLSAVAYRGYYSAEKKSAESANKFHSATVITVPALKIRPLEGESKIGYFSPDTAELFKELPKC